MAQGKKYNDDVKEKAFAMLAVNDNLSDVAKQLGIPITTLATWKKQMQSKYELSEDTNSNEVAFVKLRNEKKKEFVNNAWEIIEKAQELLKRRVNRALFEEDEIDNLINDIYRKSKDSEGDLSRDQKIAISKKLNSLKLEDIGRLSTLLGTMYDKQALASNDSTVNVGGATLEEFIKKVGGNSEY